MRAIFLDRDGTINAGAPKYDFVDSPDKVELLPHTLQALRLLAGLDYGLFVITNQRSIAEGRLTEAGFHAINDKILRLIAPSGANIIQTYFCPHGVDDGCECRKPRPGLLRRAAKEHGLDLAASYMVGDRVADIGAGNAAGATAILVRTGIPGTDGTDAAYIAADLLDAARYIAGR